MPLTSRITKAEFTRYGEWFQRNLVPEVDQRRFTLVERDGTGFVLTLDDGERIRAARACGGCMG